MAFARLAERGLDAAESLLHSSREKAVIGKHAFLSGYFRPVDAETAPTELGCAEGTVPPFLDGAFVRIGPSVALPPAGQYHLFDGDGLLASVRCAAQGTPECVGSPLAQRWSLVQPRTP